MSTPVLILAHNCLDLTKRCVESVLAQDVEVSPFVIDNGSTDGTGDWLNDMLGKVGSISWPDNRGVSYGWNTGLDMFFQDTAQCVLVLNNDTVIPQWFMRALAYYGLAYNLDTFVTGVATNDMGLLDRLPGVCEPSPHPDFSAFLIGRSVWEKVGRFDERMKFYAQDTDYHVRAHRLGVKLWKANVPYFHINSQTLHRATPQERHAIQEQANRDREVFRSIYGVLPGTKGYEDLFKEPCGQAQAK